MDKSKSKRIKSESSAKRIKTETIDASSSSSLNQRKSKRIKSEPKTNEIKVEKSDAIPSCSNAAIPSSNLDKPTGKRIKTEPKSDQIKVEKSDAIPSSSNSAIPSSNVAEPTVASTSTRKIETNDKKKAKNSLAQKLIDSRPYNLFLTCVTSSPQTHTEPLSITFMDILHESLGELECSVQINYQVEANWLFSQYTLAGHMDKPLLIIYGEENGIHRVLSEISNEKPQVTAKRVSKVSVYGSHHSKMMLFGYKDGSMRVIVSAANLVEGDWNNCTQGHWISEKLEALLEGSDQTIGESATKFRNDLLEYLSTYKLPQLEPWLTRIRNTDFTPVNVFLVTSIPGNHPRFWDGFHEYGHGRISNLLSKHSPPIADRSWIIAQCSALGVYKNWLREEFVGSLKSSDIRIIYPSFSNVATSYDGLSGERCLHYDIRRHRQQTWLKQHLYQWQADSRNRSKAMPHIKTYCRLSDTKLFWFILTSANLSKSAWGSTAYGRPRYRKSRYHDYYDDEVMMTTDNDSDDDDDDDALEISNYEVGVLFVPKFVTNTTHFSLNENDKETPVFPLPYDLPLTKYAADDIPFMNDFTPPKYR